MSRNRFEVKDHDGRRRVYDRVMRAWASEKVGHATAAVLADEMNAAWSERASTTQMPALRPAPRVRVTVKFGAVR